MEPEQEFDFNFPRYKKLFFVLSPAYLYRRFIARQKFYDMEYDRAIYLFNEKRIDFIPKPISNDGSRGFKIIIDRKKAIGFVQEGDHFIFEGDERGEQETGDVAIFDQFR